MSEAAAKLTKAPDPTAVALTVMQPSSEVPPSALLPAKPLAPASGVFSQQPLAANPASVMAPQVGANSSSGPFVYLLPPAASQPTVDIWARSFAGLGVFFGLVGLIFGIWKMISDRRLSILDEFWLRKIISPAAIEPSIKTMSHLLAAAPGASSKPKQHQAFAAKMTQDIQRLMGGMQTLAMLDADLPALMQAELSKCEDLFGDYIQALATQQAPDVAELHSAVWLAMNDALKPVQKWQSNALFRRKLAPKQSNCSPD